MVCSIAPLDLCSRYYLSFKSSGMVVKDLMAESLCDSDGNSNMKCGEVVSGKRVACLEM